MGASPQVRYRRSPHLVCYWHGAQLVFENFATGRRTSADPVTCEILHFFDRWRTIDAFARRHPGFSRRVLTRVARTLTEYSLLQSSAEAPHPAEAAMDRWAAWNPAAGFFHRSTRDVPFAPFEATARSLRARSRTRPMPAPVKTYPDARVVALPAPHSEGEFPATLLGRRTWRQFAAGPVSIDDLATVLGLSARVQRWVTARGEGRVPLKTSPSGGARHPTEVYVLALGIDNVPRGLYHYRADAHHLELVRPGARRAEIERFLPTQWWYRGAAAVFLLTTCFDRSLWRYEYARAYRAVLIEAGHLCQTLCLAATWLGLAPFCTMALADSAIEKALGVDGISESVLYAAGIGRRPSGVEWGPGPVRRRLPGRSV